MKHPFQPTRLRSKKMRCFCVGFFHLKTDHPFRHAKKHLPTLRNGLRVRSMNSKSAGYPRFRLVTGHSRYAGHFVRVRSVNSLGFTAGMQKNKRVEPACFFATKRIWKDTADWKINRLASMQADPLGFFSSANTPRNKIRRVGGKQAEPGVPSGFWIHRTPS